MEYAEPLEREFIVRTLAIIDQYDKHVMPGVPMDQQFDVTLLINCLLGLLILPKERCYIKIKPLPLDQLEDWGLRPEFIIDWGTCPKCRRKEEPGTLKDIVRRMRNSVAHLHVRPKGDGSEITELEFKDQNGFRAIVPVGNLRFFVRKLAQSVKP